MIDKVFAGGGNTQPGRIGLESGEEIFEPAVFVAMGVGTGPDTEFFHVVAHGSHTTGMHGRRVAKILDDIRDLSERDKITERFLAGEKPDGLALVFRDISAKEFIGFKSGGEKMDVVNEGVADAGRG